MTASSLLTRDPRLLAAAIRLDRAPIWLWLALPCIALAPTWLWMARRMQDGSDDPLGLLALAALALLVLQQRQQLLNAPRLGWLALSLAGTLAATVLRSGVGPMPALPPLAAGLVAVLALASAVIAFLPPRVAAAPIAGLAVLALPLLSSLQFYAGYPLRVVTAEASRWLLAPGFTVAREGSSLLVDGRLVIVDAPCSGVQMAWLGYFSACVVAAFWHRAHAGSNSGQLATSALGDRAFLARLPWVGLFVLAGNIVRNSVLVAFEGAGHALAQWAHETLGLVLLAAVCCGIGWTMARPTTRQVPRRISAKSIPFVSGAGHVATA